MAQQTPESPAKPRRSDTASGVAVITAALMIGLAPVRDVVDRSYLQRPEPDRLGGHRPGTGRDPDSRRVDEPRPA